MGETQWDISTTQGTRRIKDRKRFKKTDYTGLFHTYSMTLPKCIDGITNPMKNHSSMILPLLSISYLYGHGDAQMQRNMLDVSEIFEEPWKGGPYKTRITSCFREAIRLPE